MSVDDQDDSTDLSQVGTKMLFENDRVRIWEMKMEPGEIGPLHRHDLDYILIQVEGDRMAVIPDPTTAGEYNEYLEADVIPGQYFWIPKGGVERASNVGQKAYHEILVELKDGQQE